MTANFKRLLGACQRSSSIVSNLKELLLLLILINHVIERTGQAVVYNSKKVISKPIIMSEREHAGG